MTDRVAGELSGAQPTEIFAGEGVCYAEVGGGLASGVSGRFLADPPSVAIASPTSDGLAAKQRFETERLAAWFGR